MKSLFRLSLIEVNKINASIKIRADNTNLRHSLLKELNKPLLKVAFDTRRINQNTQYNPRRNLQYHIRSDSFVHNQDISKVNALHKLKEISAQVKDEFIGEPEWFDSYASDLDHAMEKVFFMADGKNFDLSCTAVQYLEQLLQSRYRLSLDAIIKNSEDDLKKIIINKDERLKNSGIYGSLSKKNRIEQRLNLIKNKDDHKNKSNKISETLSDLVCIMCDDQNKLEELKLKENILSNSLNQKKISLNIIKQDIASYKKIIDEKKAKEHLISQNLWSYYNSIKKIDAERQNIENLILNKISESTILNNNIIKDGSGLEVLIIDYNKLKQENNNKKINHNLNRQELYKKRIGSYKENVKNIEKTKEELDILINKKTYEIEKLNQKMILERPLYDAPNSERLLAEAMLKDKMAEEKATAKELLELNIKAKIDSDKINKEREGVKEHLKENLEKINELRKLK